MACYTTPLQIVCLELCINGGFERFKGFNGDVEIKILDFVLFIGRNRNRIENKRF